MNYQLMFQTISVICGITVFILMFFLGFLMESKSGSASKIAVVFTVLWFITLVFAALAAGLS